MTPTELEDQIAWLERCIAHYRSALLTNPADRQHIETMTRLAEGELERLRVAANDNVGLHPPGSG